MGDKEIIIISDLLKQTINEVNFNLTKPFPTLNNTLEKQKKLEKILFELKKELAEINLENFIQIIEEKKVFGQIFKGNDKEKDGILEQIFFFPDLAHESKKIKILKNDEKVYLQHLNPNDDNENIITIDNTDEAAEYLFNIHFKMNAEKEYKKFLIDNFNLNHKEKTIESINKENNDENNFIKDNIYEYLKYNSIQTKINGLSFYIQDIGFIEQKNKNWFILGQNQKISSTNDLENFIKNITIYKKYKEVINIDNQNQENILIEDIEKIKELTDKIIEKHTKFIDEINSQKNKANYKIEEKNIDETNFDFLQIENEKTIEEFQKQQISHYNNEIVTNMTSFDEDEVMSQIDYANMLIDEIKIEDILLNDENKELEQQIEQNFLLEESLKLTQSIEPIDLNDEINYQLNIAASSEREYEIMGMGLQDIEQFIYKDEIEIEESEIQIDEKKESQNLWDKIDSKNITVEDFFNYAAKNKFKLSPKIEKHNNELFYKTPHYIFKSKNKTFKFAIKENKWFMFDKNYSGIGLSNFIKTIYKENDIIVQEKHAQPFLNYIDENIEKIKEEKNKNEKQEILELKSNKIILEEFIDYIKNEYPFLLKISEFEKKSRNGIEKEEFKINNLTYRFKENQWFCIETRNIGKGIEELIENIFESKEEIKKYKNSVINFLNSQDFKITENIYNQEINTEENSNINLSDTKENDKNEVRNEKEIKIENNNNVIKEFQEKLVDTNEIQESFDKLTDIRVKELIEKRGIINNFKPISILEISYETKKPYKIEKISDKEYAFINSKSGEIYFKVGNNDFKKSTDLIEFICKKYKSLNYQEEIDRVEDILKPVLIEKVKQTIKIELEKQRAILIEEKIENISKDKSILNINEEKLNLEPNQKEEKQIKSKTSQEEFEELIGLDKENINSSFKNYLHDYYFEFNNKNIRTEVNQIIRRFKYDNTDMEDLIVNMEYDRSNPNNRIFTIKNEKFIIKGKSNINNEDWEIIQNNDNNPLNKNSNSLIEMFNEIYKQYNFQLRSTYFNQLVAKIKEENFFKYYPMKNLLEAFNAKKEGVNYTFGDMKIGIMDRNNIQKFTIWNYDISDTSTIVLMQIIMAYQNGYAISEESLKENKDISYGKAIKEIRNIYLNLDNFEKNIITNRSLKDNDDENDKEKYHKSLPQPSHNSEKMTRYLIKRGISPEIIQDLDGKAFYQGEYDKYKNGNTFTVVAFSNGEQATSVRGCTQESNDIKETVPGSKLDKPYIIYPSNKYSYKDDKARWKMVVFEGAIDALSYHCIYPNATKFTNFGLSGAKLITEALKSYHDVVNDKNGENEIQIVYAMDNINLNENGEPIDNASRMKYFKVIEEMEEYCYDKFLLENNDKFEHFEYTNENLIEVIINIFIEKEIFKPEEIEEIKESLQKTIFEKTTDELNIKSKEIKEILGRKIFQFQYIDTNIFKLETPESEKYGQYKDWNEYLENIVYIKLARKFIKENNIDKKEKIKLIFKQKFNNELFISDSESNIEIFKKLGKAIMNNNENLFKDYKVLNEIHNEIIYEFNDNIIETKLKKQMKSLKPE